MTPSKRHQHLAELFAEAASRPPEQREAYLAGACPDAALRAEVADLLRFSQTERGPVLSRACNDLHDWLGVEQETLCPGDRVGPYVVERLLGRGGGGAVYAARQTGVLERDVALKVLDLPDSISEPGRFAAERNAMAMLSHPHIAQVFDAAVDDQGRAYLAMEYVDGEPITAWARRDAPDVRQVVRAVLQAADALGHAHDRGVIHRDVKPSNLLVIGGRDDARVKVIDFGLVGATAAGSALRRWLGRGGEADGAAGTPLFMAPEQAEPGAVADVRADVYGLGAVLFTLLAGAPPLDLSDLRDASLPVLFEAVRDRPRASLHGTPKVPSDLAAVCDRALAPAEGRYPGVAAFAADLRRFLESRPVEAVEPTRVYLLSRFLQRHLAAITAVSVALLLLVGGLLGTSVGFIRAERQNWRFRQQLDANERINRFLSDDLLGAAVPGQEGRDVRVVDLLDRAAAALDDRFDAEPMIEADLRLTLGEAYMKLGAFAESQAMMREALALLESAAERDHPQRIRALVSLGTLAVQRDRLDEAAPLLEEALALSSDASVVRRAHAQARLMLSDIAGRRGEWDPAITHAEIAVTLAQATGDALLSVEALNMHALALDAAGRQAEAAAALAALPGQVSELLGPDHLYTALVSVNQAAVLLDQSRYAEALPLLEAAIPVVQREYGQEHPQALIVQGNLVSALANAGQIERAVSMAQELAAATERVHGSASRDTAMNYHRLAAALLEAGRAPEARAPAGRAVEIALSAVGESHWLTGQTLVTRGAIALACGDGVAARDDLVRGRAILAATLGDDHARVRSADGHLAALEATVTGR